MPETLWEKAKRTVGRPESKKGATGEPAKSIEEILAGLPKVDEHPRVKELLERNRAMSRRLGEAAAKTLAIRKQCESFGLLPLANFADFKARQLANGVKEEDITDPRNNLQAAIDEEHMLRKTVENLGQMIKVARADVQREHAPATRAAAMPTIRRLAFAILETAFASWEFARLRGLVGSRGLSPFAIGVPFPTDPFPPNLIAGGNATPHTARNFIRKIEAEKIITDAEAAEWLSRFGLTK